MPSYDPDQDSEFEDNPMPAGEYIATLTRVKQWTGDGDHAGKWATILEFTNEADETASEWIRWDEHGNPTQLTKKGNRPWIMNRALGALDYPDEAYWNTPLKERKEKGMKFDFDKSVFDALEGRKVIIGIEHNGDNDEYQNINKLLSLSRHPEAIPDGQVASSPASNPDVPF